MSTTAAAQSRTPERENQNRQPLRFLADPEEPVLQDEPAVAPVAPLDDVARMERLLSQLEARSMALVPYGYGSLRELPARKANHTLLAVVLVAIWLSTVVLAIAYIRYNRPGPLAGGSGAPLVISSEGDPQEQKVASSVDHLAKVLVSSSERMNELQAAMERSNRDLQRMATKVAERPKAASGGLKTAGVEGLPAVGAEEGSVPKNWHKILDIKPTETAVPHKGDDGMIDYWLVPRGTEQVQTKVLPIGTSAEGVVIHNLEDGQDYTLTPSGEWRSGAIVPSEN